MGVPLRRPLTNEVAFSVDPAIGVNEDTSFDSATEAVAGVELVEIAAVVLDGSAIT